MALSNLFGWKKSETEAGSACGAADKPAEKPAACGTACGAADKPEGSNRPGDDCFERTGAERRHRTFEPWQGSKKRTIPIWYRSFFKRETGIEPATPSLARRCSTAEPLAHNVQVKTCILKV